MNSFSYVIDCTIKLIKNINHRYVLGMITHNFRSRCLIMIFQNFKNHYCLKLFVRIVDIKLENFLELFKYNRHSN